MARKGYIIGDQQALKDISKAEAANGTSVLTVLEASKNNFVIDQASNNPNGQGTNEFVASNRNAAYAMAMLDETVPNPKAGGSGGTIYWDPNGGDVNELGGTPKTRPTTNLAHELFHGFDANYGLLDNREINGLGRDEWRASYFENQVRGQLGFPFRQDYGRTTGPIRILSPVSIGTGTFMMPIPMPAPSVKWFNFQK